MSDPERAYASALRILSYRFNSEAELRRKLRAKKFEADGGSTTTGLPLRSYGHGARSASARSVSAVSLARQASTVKPSTAPS